MPESILRPISRKSTSRRYDEVNDQLSYMEGGC